jgi:hypothetical protein
MGIHIPPNNPKVVDVLQEAWGLYPADCVPLVLGNLSINFDHPRDAHKEQITDLLDEINLVDESWKFASQ